MKLGRWRLLRDCEIIFANLRLTFAWSFDTFNSGRNFSSPLHSSRELFPCRTPPARERRDTCPGTPGTCRTCHVSHVSDHCCGRGGILALSSAASAPWLTDSWSSRGISPPRPGPGPLVISPHTTSVLQFWRRCTLIFTLFIVSTFYLFKSSS